MVHRRDMMAFVVTAFFYTLSITDYIYVLRSVAGHRSLLEVIWSGELTGVGVFVVVIFFSSISWVDSC